ncbi:KpsF/GutQ family sugar-phosphate isomerase [Falsiroseomonas tokyonensis]|uniref:SIS domain-containing protein n=1 Tax=Falsiroseomonas tokyonensis TaxID=430521 RepID=A0ABV7BXZ5_9PROT|nr:KpsF/GutQ family sugar-phosphate isomerase [Falsiroseomonas tokyonensis]MBU8538896.1 KpsF/GutQ family sugar-phosphate isomerase [Falsiroseomonas tokyonensis]
MAVADMAVDHGDRVRRATLQRTVRLEAEGLTALESALAGELGDRVLEAVELILRSGGRLIVTGMGKSGHVGRKIVATLASTGTPSHFVHPAEASHGDLGMIRAEDVVLALSWSGEAPELADIISYTRRFSVPLIAITSRPDSALGSASDLCLTLPRMPEACPNGLAPTTSTAMQLALGDALAMCLLEARGFSPADFREFHPGGKLGARLKRARDLMHGGSEVPLVSDQASLAEAIVQMTSRRFGVTGITDSEGRIIGILTDGDLRRAFQSGFVNGPAAAVMTRQPLTVPPDALAPDLLATMNERNITSIFVVGEEARPLGIVHLHDLLRSGIV